MIDVISFKCTKGHLSPILTCSNDFIVCSYDKDGKLALWKRNHKEKEEKVLIGHHLHVTSISLSHSPLKYLCSCSSDNIILWNLSENDGCPKQGKVLMSNLHNPQSCCFSYCNSVLYIGCDAEIVIIDLAERLHRWSLPVCSATVIVPAWNKFFASLDDNNFLKVWDMANHTVIYKNLISSGFPSAISVDKSSRFIAVGTSTGLIIIYGHHFMAIRVWKVWQMLRQRHVNSKDDSEEVEDDDFPILALDLSTSSQNDSYLSGFFPGQSTLLVVTSSCLFTVNVNREKLIFFSKFKNLKDDENCSVGLVRSAAIAARDVEINSVFISLLPVISNKVVAVKVPLDDYYQENEIEKVFLNAMAISDELSFINYNKEAILDSSYLSFKLRKRTSKDIVQRKKSSMNFSQPVTFHSKIKSSGYGTLHSLSLFRSSKTKVLKSSKLVEYTGFKMINCAVKPESICSKKPKLLSSVSIDASLGITSSKISGSGNYVLCCTNSGVTEILKIYPEEIKRFKSLSCHERALNCANWSHSGKYYITASSDRTAKFWSLAEQKQKPLLTFGSSKCQTSPSTSSKKVYTFEADVTQCQFYYLDQFVLLSSKNVLHLFAYDIQYHTNDLKRFDNQSHQQLVTKVPLECQQITSVGAVNQFRSNLVISTGTAKSLDVIDMHVGKVVWHEDNISYKLPYAVVLNEGSPNIHQDSLMHDVFLTASFDGIKIWDLRSQRSVINYNEHSCRTVPCGVSFSPCGGYVATGSEDKSVYIYDLRSMCHLHRLQNLADIVTSVSFSPSHAQLLSTTLNGVVYLYGS